MDYDPESNDGHPSVVLKSQRYETSEEAKHRYEIEMDSYKRQEMWERGELARLKAKYDNPVDELGFLLEAARS
jgi:hypothetical protein